MSSLTNLCGLLRECYEQEYGKSENVCVETWNLLTKAEKDITDVVSNDGGISEEENNNILQIIYYASWCGFEELVRTIFNVFDKQGLCHLLA